MTNDPLAKGAQSLLVTKEELLNRAQKYNLLNNTFMTAALNDAAACSHVLRILTGIPDLTVRQIRTQYRISRITSHDAILDVLAEDARGQLYNLEIQRADTPDHARRTRFYGAMIDTEYLQKGLRYQALPEVHIIYISETDIWKAGKTVYRVQKNLSGNAGSYDDGLHILYVNAAIDDGSDIAGLMAYFKTADPGDMSQGDLSKRVHFLKCEEGGQKIMDQVTEEIMELGKREGQRMIVRNLSMAGMPAKQISQMANLDLDLVKQWLETDN